MFLDVCEINKTGSSKSTIQWLVSKIHYINRENKVKVFETIGSIATSHDIARNVDEAHIGTPQIGTNSSFCMKKTICICIFLNRR